MPFDPRSSRIDDLDLLCNELLSAIEIREARVLDWGFINISLTRGDLETILADGLHHLPEMVQTIWEELHAAGVNQDDLIENLLERMLLFEIPEGRYRTRFAETVRLLHQLRQRFKDDDWQTAPRLVSDVRLNLKRREYPLRDISAEQLHTDLARLRLDSLEESILALLLNDHEQAIRLSSFQEEAITRIFQNLREPQDSAVVIGAGTGAGKTKAFYIPALAYIGQQLKAEEHHVQALALYPRNELLKDQLQETFSEVRKLRKVLPRNIILGAYFGDVLNRAADLLATNTRMRSKWGLAEDGQGWLCPFFRCPDCDSDMIWARADVEKASKRNGQSYARLQCIDPNCGCKVGPDELLLTRDQMVKTPPDILFTTTEMLNRRLGRASEHTLFGIDSTRPPRLLLLDEIHTYTDSHGAQVSYLLRRWQHLRHRKIRDSLVVVGLSATLADAETFFHDLTGIDPHRVFYVRPKAKDLIRQGIEYNLVVKGDPASGTSLLATSVQTVMLMARSLDPLHSATNPELHEPSRGAVGQKVFAFSDKLDVINRWNHIEEDAETHKILSQYRLVDPFDEELWHLMDESGQNWWFATQIGHHLDSPLRIGLTTSQYRGVDAEANLVIATSTLEVGYNDRSVGAVVQHKAPRDIASFIQRKGRAGRDPKMRPWTVVVTSDYGQDRWAFQHAEHLFEPEIPPIDLPLNNYYIYKIQATYAFMDWLALRIKEINPDADIRKLLTNSQGKIDSSTKTLRTAAAHEIRRVLTQPSAREGLQQFLADALHLGFDGLEVNSILWGPPRSLLFHVLPSILRQLETGWQQIDPITYVDRPGADEPSGIDMPLPSFVPPALFSDLNLPELVLQVPHAHAQETQNISMDLGLAEFAPGNVSKRYADRRDLDDAHWLNPQLEHLVDEQIGLESLSVSWDEVPLHREVNGIDYLVLRPRQYQLDRVPRNVRSTSSGSLLWQSTFHPRSVGVDDSHNRADGQPGTPLQLSTTSRWKEVLEEIRVFTQATGSWVEATRLAQSVKLDLRFASGNNDSRTLSFSLGHKPAAIGFLIDVDALRFRFKQLAYHDLQSQPSWSDLYRHIGQAYFRDRLHEDRRLVDLSPFAIDSLWQIHLSILISVAVEHQSSLAEAAQRASEHYSAKALSTLDFMFHSVDESGVHEASRVRETLEGHLNDPNIQQALMEHARVIWDDKDPGLDQWLQQSYAHSLGAVLFATIIGLIPEIEPETLHLDVQTDEIWISELNPGGVGVIAKIAGRIARHPREFDMLMWENIEFCDREEMAAYLRSITSILSDDETLSGVFARLRASTDLLHVEQVREELSSVLEQQGIPSTRQLGVALNTKLLRPNSGIDTDALIGELVRFWQSEEERLRCAIDLRVIALAAYHFPPIHQHIAQILNRIGGGEQLDEEHRIFNLIQSLLWLDCQDACPTCIQGYHRYQSGHYISRKLVKAVLPEVVQSLRFGDVDWREMVRLELINNSIVRIVCDQGHLDACKISLLDMTFQPVEVGYQMFYPSVERIERHGLDWSIYIVLSELLDE